MISIALALRLRAAGLAWQPSGGDRFAVRQPEMAGETFVLSDMTIEVHDFPSGPVIGFNGTTEWALDSVAQESTVWLPHEHQLRALIGEEFRSLERTPDGDHLVRVRTADGEVAFAHAEPAEAYGEALLHLLVDRAARGLTRA